MKKEFIVEVKDYETLSYYSFTTTKPEKQLKRIRKKEKLSVYSVTVKRKEPTR